MSLSNFALGALAPLGSSAVVRVVLLVGRSQEVINNKIGYFAAQSLTSSKVKAEMDSGENPAQGSLFCSIRDSRERALHTRQNFRGDIEVEVVRLEERSQDTSRSSTNNRVCARVGGSGVVLPTCGSQFGSAAVSGLLSVSAARMAVTGRQKLYVYFVS